MEDLKPCPFCGQQKRQLLTSRSGQMSEKCGCGAMGPIDYPKEQAALIWNTRPIEDALQVQVNYQAYEIQRLRKKANELIGTVEMLYASYMQFMPVTGHEDEMDLMMASVKKARSESESLKIS